jgi:hypothetical protein
MPDDLRTLSDGELLRLLGAVPDELKRRGLVRSTRKSPTGELAEALVARTLGTEIEGGRDEGWDLKDAAGRRVQVKGCRCPNVDATTQFGDMDLDPENQRFDDFVGVVFDPDYVVREAWRMPWATVERLAKTRYGRRRLYVRDVIRAVEEGDKSITKFDLGQDPPDGGAH